ncbi:hypothetical protein [Desulfotalea psychrophila]|uniref:Similar to arginine decarboxylase (Partial length) n=1 Tax=Desulfotalea psychrophila (strain LSv54 / DSM 12343) TaxID=177439 RepID=Q6ALP4_DESPS|nr:hypothetical protein [Desulfotalea psychrophila]CAG36731.1 similar to arginine decarboxylase (partial length) [Desulfotalea psychrophila LSv54]
MPTITIKNAHHLPDPGFGGTPYGNVTALKYGFEVDATGAVANGNSINAVAVNDKVILGVIEAGTKLVDAVAIVTNACTAQTAFNLGFEYVDGDDSAEVPQDLAYLFAGASSAAVAVIRRTVAKGSVRMPKNAYLVLTAKGAAHATDGKVEFYVQGIS